MVTKRALVPDIQCYCIYLLFGEIVQSVQLKTDKADGVYKAIHRVVHQQSLLCTVYFNLGIVCCEVDNISAA